jgi:hypothetical protein
METGIRDWGNADMASLAEAVPMFVAAIPKIFGFVVILILGWFIAALVEKSVGALLRTGKLRNLTARSGFGDFFRRINVKAEAAGFFALIVLVAAFNAIGLPAVSDVVRQLLSGLSNLAVAFVVLVIGGLAAGALSSLVRGAASSAKLDNPNVFARITNVIIRVFAIVTAINQIEIITTLADALILATVGAVTLALGLTFGSTGRVTAAQIARSWYEKGKQAIPRMTGATQDVQGQAQQQGRQPMQPGR